MITKKILIIGISCIFILSAVIAGALYLHLYTPSIKLPGDPVTMIVTDGDVSYFNTYLSEVPLGYDVTNGLYVGWCSDRSVHMPRNQEVKVKLFNSYALLLPPSIASKNWSQVNYILNHKGDATKTDIQDAIWHLLNKYPYDEISDTAKMLVDTSQNDYRPMEGDIIAVIAMPYDNPFAVQRSFLEVRLPPQEGKTPGFWMNHPSDWPDGYTQTMLVKDVFENVSEYPELLDDTLLKALNYGGGPGDLGMAKLLLRHAVAAVLNARHPNINYPILESTIIEEVNRALSTHDKTKMEFLKDILESANELEADLSQ